MARRRKELGSELNPRIAATSKILPETYNWFVNAPWLKELSISKILETMVEYAKLNEEDFKKYCEKYIEETNRFNRR